MAVLVFTRLRRGFKFLNYSKGKVICEAAALKSRFFENNYTLLYSQLPCQFFKNLKTN